MGVKYLERKSRNQRTIGFGYLENLKEFSRFHERTGKESWFSLSSQAPKILKPTKSQIGASSLTVLRFGFRLGLEFKVKVRFCISHTIEKPLGCL